MAKQDDHSEITPFDPARHGIASDGAELAAYTICKQPIDLNGRREVKGYAIDSADPDSPMDRDDAIGIRFSDDPDKGRLATLDVSIADVASVSPPAKKSKDDSLAALDEFAFKNGESLYFSHGVSPMLPHQLQNRLSLENGQIRPTITISVTFNQQGQPIHTEFARTYIKTKCKSYRDAARDILLYGDPIQKISVVANQLLNHKSDVTDLPHYDEQTGTYTDAEGNIRHISRDELSAFKTVQGSMIAANEAAATVMSGSPFLFRNHSHSYRNSPEFYSKGEMSEFEGREGRIMQNKAEYSTVCRGHFGLNAERYSHITSPMRRYADLVNQRMMGWAIDVVDAISQSITSNPAWNVEAAPPEKVSYALWDHASTVLQKASALKDSTSKGVSATQELEQQIAAIITELSPDTKLSATKMAKTAVAQVSTFDLPYKSRKLTYISKTLNEILARNRATRREMHINEANVWLERVFPTPDAKMLQHWGSDNFARLLEAAARRGDNHDVFAKEAVGRLDSDQDTLVQNLHSILVVAQRHKDSHWQELKRKAFQKLKDGAKKGNQATLAEKVFEYTQAHTEYQPQQKELFSEPEAKHEVRIIFLEATLIDHNGHRIPSALVVLNHDNKDYSAPIIDTAETPEKARQAAILTFFRHYGDLYPHQEMYTPKLIGLAHERAKVKKGDRLQLLEKMCTPHFDISIGQRITEEMKGTLREPTKQLEITLRVTSKEGGETMVKTHKGSPNTYEQIVDKAAKYMLEDRRFHDMLSQYHRQREMDGLVDDANTITPQIIWSDPTTANRFIDRRPPSIGEVR